MDKIHIESRGGGEKVMRRAMVIVGLEGKRRTKRSKM
jgi:hypothetical protein